MTEAPLSRVDALPLIEATDDALVALLRGLSDEEWERPAVGNWSVRNVAAHLLDGNLRRLSFVRDGLSPAPPDEPIDDFTSLVGFLNRLNDDWTRATRRLSGRVIADWIAETNPEVRATLAKLDPDGPAPFPVDWAGQDQTSAWLDIGREYTEKWHHQQQIREATSRPGLVERRFVEPLLEILLRALPRVYDRAFANDTARVEIHITDFPGSGFLLAGTTEGFRLFRLFCAEEARDLEPHAAAIRLASDTAWRSLMKGMSAEEARSRAEVRGATELTEPFFSALAVMA